MKRLNRKQPRRLTPPLILREGVERACILVDEEFVLERPHLSGCVHAYLNLGAGLRVRVGSRCVNKRRIPVLTIRRSDQVDGPEPPAETYRAAVAAMEPTTRKEVN